MKKNIVKLTESQLHKVIKESVKMVLREGVKDGSNPISATWDSEDFATQMMYDDDPDDPDVIGKKYDEVVNGENADITRYILNGISKIAKDNNVSFKRAEQMMKGAFDRVSSAFIH